jgi:hypothetical protein
MAVEVDDAPQSFRRTSSWTSMEMEAARSRKPSTAAFHRLLSGSSLPAEQRAAS